MSENQKRLLQQALDMLEEQALHIKAPMLPAGEELLNSIRAAISQQAEPVCRCTMSQRMVGDGCYVCNPEYAADHEAEPAPAQDEPLIRPGGTGASCSCPDQCDYHRSFAKAEPSPAQALRKMMTELEEIALIQPDCSKTELILKAVEALTTRPAQTEQKPVAVPESWWKLIHDTLLNYRVGTLEDGYGGGYPLIDAMAADGQSVRGGIEECIYLADAIWNALRASPIAQTAPQPEQSGLVEAAGAVIRAADWWSANEDSPKSALAHFARATDALRAALSAQGPNP